MLKFEKLRVWSLEELVGFYSTRRLPEQLHKKAPTYIGIVAACLYSSSFLYRDWAEWRGIALLAQLLASFGLAVTAAIWGRKWWLVLCALILATIVLVLAAVAV
jgi:hypothetical protein